MLWGPRAVHRQEGRRHRPLFRSSPVNPFVQSVQVSFSGGRRRPGAGGALRQHPLHRGLPDAPALDWRATTEVALGSAHYDYVQTIVEYAPQLRPVSATPPNPFGNWTDFQTALAAFRTTSTNAQSITNDFRDISLRLAGPVFHTVDGSSTLTLLAERRTEKVPAYLNLTVTDAVPSPVAIASRTTRHDLLLRRAQVPRLRRDGPRAVPAEPGTPVRRPQRRRDGPLRAKSARAGYDRTAARPLRGDGLHRGGQGFPDALADAARQLRHRRDAAGPDGPHRNRRRLRLPRHGRQRSQARPAGSPGTAGPSPSNSAAPPTWRPFGPAPRRSAAC